MNKLFLSLLLSAFCCLACRSQANHDAIPSGTITADIDGVATSFNITAKAALAKHGNGYTYGIRGVKNTSVAADIIAIAVLSKHQIISTGTYDNSSMDAPFTAFIQFMERGKNFIVYSNMAANNKGIVTITSIQNGRIQGTFNGVLKGSNGLTINITNGKFDVKTETK
jgi:hypothetical protein